MKYHFKVGRAKDIIISDSKTFENLGFEILKEYKKYPDHLFMFVFANGEETNSCSPFGPMEDDRDVRIDMPIKNRKIEVGEIMTFIYDYSCEWTRKVTLVEKIDEREKAAEGAEKKPAARGTKKAKAEAEEKAPAVEKKPAAKGTKKAKADAEEKAPAVEEKKPAARGTKKAKAEAEEKAPAVEEKKPAAKGTKKAKAEAEEKDPAVAEEKAPEEAEKKPATAVKKRRIARLVKRTPEGDYKKITE